MDKLLVGVKDWCDRQWIAGFYPADLPEDWRLGYYANEYGTTVIDLAAFDPAGRKGLLHELADCHDGFSPVLKVSTAKLTRDEVSAFMRDIDQQDQEYGFGRLAGVWLYGPDLSNANEINAWRAVIQSRLPIAASIDHEFYEANKAALQADKITSPVSISQESADIQAGWLALVSLSMPPRLLASKLGVFLGMQNTEGPVCLIALDGYSSFEKMQEFSTIVELLGG